MKKLSKTEAREKVAEFFEDIKNKSAKDVKKIKKLAMSHNIPLREKRKLFCRKCYSRDLRIKRIKNKIKTSECRNCGNIMRWKIS
jgi:RNase P subunit RPR2